MGYHNELQEEEETTLRKRTRELPPGGGMAGSEKIVDPYKVEEAGATPRHAVLHGLAPKEWQPVQSVRHGILTYPRFTPHGKAACPVRLSHAYEARGDFRGGGMRACWAVALGKRLAARNTARGNK